MVKKDIVKLFFNNIYINRWNEDNFKKEELFDWEKEILDLSDNRDIPLNYIIKKP